MRVHLGVTMSREMFPGRDHAMFLQPADERRAEGAAAAGVSQADARAAVGMQQDPHSAVGSG